MSAFIIIPILFLLFSGQMSGLFMLSNSVLLIIGAGVFVLDYFLMVNATKKFIPEKLI